ncbi:putative calmodulin-binding protein CaM-BP15 [Cavenderia fasciculata]|uniref:Calmodulin-binding protein CaM-BP15 n=1 Tax=Cavenderia fasciculata TaxID=261658 RepID=F4PLX2_CACFS|nr:putative calmodulin-binding protein CaM-BP15 [Cavenderia fasciculata]EGG23526.1 putative calmodulin-binding protein CaM-BP15 [Cavenderia fasciculata]|eukprot:XP_004361377.1 putative calmodulin-binding protein CaM-BP15 [Cavenderia fasciculata]
MKTLIIISSILLLLCLVSCIQGEEAYFSFKTQGSIHDFVFKLTDPKLINHARKLISGQIDSQPHIMGKIKKLSKPYNPHYEFHMDPDQISFFDFAIEVCDASLPYLEDNLKDACGAFLPGCMFCPWSSQLVEEVHPKVDKK